MSIHIIIADDHAVFRSGLRALLEREDDLEVVAETADGQATLDALDRDSANVLILDISMPGPSGPKLAQAALEKHADLAIVVLTMHEDEFYVQEMLAAGAQGFVLKKSTGSEVIQAVRAVHRGEQYVDSGMAGTVLRSYLGRRNRRNVQSKADLLTPREKEVCSLLARGHTNNEIAERLSISERTVETHRAHIMAKLDLKSRADLVRFAIEHGLLKVE